MGMPVVIEVADVKSARDATARAVACLRRADKLFSTYKPTSEISRLNQGTLSESELSPVVKGVLQTCHDLTGKTDGFFDINQGGKIDPSGYVKGWAIREAAKAIESCGIRDYMVEVAGDMQLGGHGPEGRSWQIGIINPLKPDTLAKVLLLTNCAVATSGTYIRGQHIYNPKTGQTVEDPVSLTVVGRHIDEVDAVATAAFCMGDQALTWLKAHGFEAMSISRVGLVQVTSGFRRYEL